MNTLLPQGCTGALALDKVLRGCTGNETGSTLHVCVLYSKLRLHIIKEVFVRHRRVLLPGCMTLYTEPVKVAKLMTTRVLLRRVTPWVRQL